MNTNLDSMDISMRKRSYKEFVLDKVDEDNLKEIEKNFREGKITSANKEEIMDYLGRLYNKIKDIKALEYEFEGELNINVNTYLQRIRSILDRLHQI